MSIVVPIVGVVLVCLAAIAVAAPLLQVGERRQVAGGVVPARRRLEKEKELAYGAIKEAEFDFEMGKLSPEDYAILREKYEARAMQALEALERMP